MFDWLIGSWVLLSMFLCGSGGDSVVGDLVGGRVISDCPLVCSVVFSVILFVDRFVGDFGLVDVSVGVDGVMMSSDEKSGK